MDCIAILKDGMGPGSTPADRQSKYLFSGEVIGLEWILRI
jgi:hypothetical protein